MSKKAPTIELAANWTTARVNDGNACVGTINSGVTTSFCIKEINSAPVDIETCKSRTYALRNPSSLNKPFSKGYSEQFIKVTVPFTDETYLKEIDEKSKWTLIKREPASSAGSTVYTFEVSLKTDPKEKQI